MDWIKAVTGRDEELLVTSFYTLITIENCVIRNKEKMMNNNDEDDEMKLKDMRLYLSLGVELL